jgi:uncharacterized protein YbbC (DUF1343 family)
MEACAEAAKPLYVLDRPNPIGGDFSAAEGPTLDEAHLSSFVGRWNIPIRYSLTIGELARLWNAERKLRADLHVVQVTGWSRAQHWPDTRLPFVKLSPAMPSYESALLYPGTCLFEGTNLSEGRGTDASFQLIGAPWIDSTSLASGFNALNLPGILAHPAAFIPGDRKHSGASCHGLRLEITNPITFRPVRSGLNLLAQIIRLHPHDFRWLTYPTTASPTGTNHFDKLIGQIHIRPALDAQPPDLAQQIDQWTASGDWPTRAAPYLLYS